MTIKTFTSEFQDNIFTRNPIFHLMLKPQDISTSDMYVTVKHAEELVNSFQESVDFLERESDGIEEEVIQIFQSLYNKIDKINNYSSAVLGLNATFEDRYSIQNINPYDLKISNHNWNYTESCLTLPGTSTKIQLKPYKTISTEGIKTFYYVIPSSFSFKGITLNKTYKSTELTAIECLDRSKVSLTREYFEKNDNKLNVFTNIPLSANVIIVEVLTNDIDEEVSITPDNFDYQKTKEFSLLKSTYKYSTFFTLDTKVELPVDTYIQANLKFDFFDINSRYLESINTSININGDGNLIDYYKNLKDFEKVLYIYKDGVKQQVEDITEIEENDVVIYKPKLSTQFEVISEDTLKFNIRNAKTFTCTPTLKFYSLTNEKLTPKLYTMIGITKDESNKY